MYKPLLKVFLVVLTVAFCIGTANAQSIGAGTPTGTFSYTQGGGSNTISMTSIIGDPSATYTAAVVYTGASSSFSWITLSSSTSGTTQPFDCSIAPDTLTVAGSGAVLSTMPAGVYVATVNLTASDTSTTSIVVTLTVTSPLTAGTPGKTALSWVLNGAANQPASTTTVTVSNSDASADTFTMVKTNCPNWLTITASPVTTAPFQASSSAAEILTFLIDSTKLNGVAAGTTVSNCQVALDYNGVAFSTVSFTSLAVVSQPLLISNPTVSLLVYNKGTSTANPSSTSVTVSVAAGTSSTLFNLDLATLPAWLTVSSGLTNNAANATVGGTPVVFAVNTAVAAGMATGNYVANVGFFVSGFADLKTAISMQVSNAAPGVTAIANSPTTVAFTTSTPTPSPTGSIFSSNEPVPFTATCTVVKTAPYTATAGFATPCLLNGLPNTTATNVVNGTAFTWGFGITATLDPVLFQATIGNTVQVTITFSNLSSAPAPLVYLYTIQPGLPTATGTMPSSVSANFSKTAAAAVLVKGTNFIGTQNIAPAGGIVQSQVWLNGTQLTNANAGTVGSYVVVDASHIMVTIAAGTLPVVASGHTGSVTIGVANQVGLLPPTAVQATATLNITYAPVVYGATSTASFVQPGVGASPSFAPYELISLFGDNFGPTSGNFGSATFDAYGKVVTPIIAVPASGSTKAITMSVTFKDVATGKTSFTAPVLFVNQNQVNALVPSAASGDQNVTVTVGTAVSDNFLVHIVPADPGIFTLLSDGTGQGAIVNQDGTINGVAHVAKPSDFVSIYLTGLGAPDSTGQDIAPTVATNFPGTCVAINGSAGSPGLLQVKNAKVAGYTAPTWTNIDGAVINYGPHDIITGANPNQQNLPPCMKTAAITITFGTAANHVTGTVTYAGFVSGAVAGLYQINVQLPASFTPGGGTLLTGSVPVSLTITPAGGSAYAIPSGVTMYFQ